MVNWLIEWLIDCSTISQLLCFSSCINSLTDAELAMDVRVSAVVKGFFYQLRHLRSVQRSLALDAWRAIVTAFIISRLDYCNALLYGVAKAEIQRLQTVMNAAARLVSGLGRYDHVTPVLRDTLHWLPIRQRVVFKLAVLAFNCVRGTCPSYFRGVCTPLTEVSGRLRLRSTQRGDLYVPATPQGPNLVRAVSELLRRKHGTLHRYISVHQPSAEISSRLDSNPTCSSAATHDFTSENYWGVN